MITGGRAQAARLVPDEIGVKTTRLRTPWAGRRIVLVGGERIIVGPDVDATALTRIIKAHAAMIAIRSGARVWLVTGRTDMLKGFDGLAQIVQETLKRDPHSGHLFVFRGRRGSLIKFLWSDGEGLCLFSKRLERGRFLWPSLADGTVTISTTSFPFSCPASIGACCKRSGARRRSDRKQSIEDLKKGRLKSPIL
jgi:transposase